MFARQGLQGFVADGRGFGCREEVGILGSAAEQQGIQFGIVLDVGFTLAAFDLVQRRLRDVDVAALDELRHLPVEERE